VSPEKQIEDTLATMFARWEVMMLADDLGVALYRWTHEFPHERIAGCTSQIFRKLDDRWLVIHENSARVPRD
jgi:hypothetical protein